MLIGILVKIIIGLGNIGDEYRETRHNMGFMVVDELARSHGAEFKNDRYLRAGIAKITVDQQQVLLVKPTTYMNRSGEALKACLERYEDVRLSQDVLVVYDDVALELGFARFRARGTSGGQKGIESIITAAGSNVFCRLKVGIRSGHVSGDLSRYVLGKFRASEKESVITIVSAMAGAVERFVKFGVDTIANEINGQCLLSDLGTKEGIK